MMYPHIYLDFCITAIRKNCKSYCKGKRPILLASFGITLAGWLDAETDEFANAADEWSNKNKSEGQCLSARLVLKDIILSQPKSYHI